MGISQGGEGKGSLFTEINITPLTDIFLVLLIIMMVIAPMFQQANKSIKVPEIKAGEALTDDKVTVELTQAGEIFVNGTKTAAAELVSSLTALATKTQDKIIVVRADQATKSSEVMKVYEAAGQAGYEKLTIAGEPLSTSREQTLESGAADNKKPNDTTNEVHP
jgi:biopolymer transport protein ExbD